MPADTCTKMGFLTRYRLWVILGFMVLMLPPLAAVFQFTGDSNFCGSWCPRMFFVWREGLSLQDYLAGFMRSYMGVALVGGVLVSTFFFGRYWCSHVCPIGGTMEAGSRVLPKKAKLSFAGIPASSFRYGYLAVYFIASAIGVGSLCCNYCNFATVPRMFGAAFSMGDAAYFFRTAGLINLGLIVLLGFAAKGGRAYCNLICPIGALDAISNRLGARFGRRVRLDASKCNGCGVCRKVCPTWAIEPDSEKVRIDQLSCMPCRECEKVCKKEAIGYGKHTA